MSKCSFLSGAFQPCKELKCFTDAGDSIRLVTYQHKQKDEPPFIHIGVSLYGRTFIYCPFCGERLESPAIRKSESQ